MESHNVLRASVVAEGYEPATLTGVYAQPYVCTLPATSGASTCMRHMSKRLARLQPQVCIVALTTSGVAKNQQLVAALQPKVWVDFLKDN